MLGGGSTGVSQITFGTDGWRAPAAEFTADRVRRVGRAVAQHLDARAIEEPVAVGYDAREHSEARAEALAGAIAAGGRTVRVATRDLPTPAVAWTVAEGEYAGGLMVTASHNPPGYNGVKFVPADGAPAPPAVTDDIEGRIGDAAAGGAFERRNFREPYVDAVLGAVDADLTGRTIAYDAMHGSGRGVTDRVLEAAGATVRGHRCERDPAFGGTAPNPGPERAAGLVEAVASGAADLGVVNDGDADRVGLVAPGVGYLDESLVLAVLYEFLLERATGDAVRTVSTSSLVDGVAAAAGRAVHETPVGFKWVAEAMAETDALIGGEESGGYGLGAHLRNKDGVVAALLAAAADAERPLAERVRELRASHGPVFQDRTSVPCPDDRKAGTMETLVGDPPERVGGRAVARRETVDGLKLYLEGGAWVLVRPSGTEPKLRIYAEATDEETLGALLSAARERVAGLRS